MSTSAKRQLPLWEMALVVAILAAGAWSSTLSPYYLSVDQLFGSTRAFIIPGLLALGLAVVVSLGEIDISLASIIAVGTVALSKLSAAGVPFAVAAPIVVAIGALCGAFNGLLVAKWRLPSLAVTLGTMGAFRGLAFIAGSEVGYTDFDDVYLWLGSDYVFGGVVPVSLILFALAAAGVWFLMHRTGYGRRCFSIGLNPDAAWFAGVDVVGVKIRAYALAGALAGAAALVWVGQYGSARGDNADGSILFVVTAVVLGGMDINGGRGTLSGVVLALFLLGTIRNGLGLANVGGPTQTVVLGGLLVAGVLRPAAAAAIARLSRPAKTREARAQGE
ncbi:ABC transporter permease [Siculibacillus lacustris]|uniref:Autoinducer 2 import system permease protein LsrD n=1 Tax=Siculibacillus lacustris TaxID=1549641 RepID=A0A4Q9VZD9_9HYPH|nr:ABC transporter permease [Siculibacillus lacustris]TBW40736.1 ABC transporter permease [Siculibacillus lacustris]